MTMPHAETVLNFSRKQSIGDLQYVFNRAYPFLKIEFYTDNPQRRPGKKQYLKSTLPLTAAGLTETGTMMLTDTMTVDQLEKQLKNKFGLKAHAFRKSGPVWLEISMTGNWTLQHQNNHGRELTEHVQFYSIPAREVQDNDQE